MLMALNNQNHYIYAENANSNQSYYCPACHEKLLLKCGNYVVSHFAHQKRSHCNVGSEGETLVHLRGKRQLMQFFAYSFSKINLEHYLQSIHQRPDLMLNNHLVIEYQCSPIPTQRLNERLRGYESLNIVSKWILGPKYYQQNLSTKLCQQFMSYSNQLGFFMNFWLVDLKALIVRYQIRSINGRFKYLEQRFFSWQDYYRFINFDHDKPKLCFNNMIQETIRLRNKIIFKDVKTLHVQNFCYQLGYNLLGCPVICHYPIIEMPWYPNRIIELRVMVLLLLEQNQKISFKQLIQKLSEYFSIRTNFCMLDFNLSNQIIINFVKILCRNRYLSIQNNQLYLLRSFRWYHDEAEKILVIKKISKRDH